MGKNKHKRPHGDRGPLAGQVAVKQSKIDKASSCATIELPSLLNPAHAATAAISEYKAAFASAAPFPHLRLRDFFKDPSFLEALKTELLALDFAEKVKLAQTGSAPQALLAAFMLCGFFVLVRRATTCTNSVNPMT